MKFLDEYRDEALAAKLVDEIRYVVTKSWVLIIVLFSLWLFNVRSEFEDSKRVSAPDNCYDRRK